MKTTRRTPCGLLFSVLLTAGLAGAGNAQPTVVVTATGVQRDLTPYFLGFVTQTAFGPSWSDPQFLAAIPQLMPEALRYPGGQNGNYWDWQGGWFLASTGYQSGLPPNYYRLQDLKNAVLLTGATPDYMVNMLSSDLPTQMSMLRTAKSMGLPVQLIELGNEFSLDVPAYVSKFPTGADYGAAASQWIAGIKSEFPQARVAISTRTGFKWSSGSTREQTWNQQVLAAAPNPDAIIMHTYPPIDGLFNVSLDNSEPETLQQQSAETAALQDSTAVPNILGAPFDAYATVERNIQTLPAGFGPNTRVWVTEYDLDKTFYAVHGTWLHGLFAGALTALYLQDARIELIDFFNMCDQPLHGAMFSNGIGFRAFLNPVPTQMYGLTAVGSVLREFAVALNRMTTAQALIFNPAPSIARSGAASYPALIGWLFSNGVARASVILNLSSAPVPLDLTDPSMRPRFFEQLTDDPLMRVTGFTAPQKTTGLASPSIMLTPYSITRLSWQSSRRHATHP